jgi:hypothetical protein
VHRRLVILTCLAACGPYTAKPPSEPPVSVSLAATPPQFVPGERMTWHVFWRAVEIGEVDYEVGARAAHSRFQTNLLASAFGSAGYELATAFDVTGVRTATEVLTRKGETHRMMTSFDGASYRIADGEPRIAPGGGRLHTLHTALDVVRTWSKSKPRKPGYLWFTYQGKLSRLDVVTPVGDEALGLRALRVDGVVRALDRSTSADVSIWLAANSERAPLKLEIKSGGEQITAELVASTASFGTR